MKVIRDYIEVLFLQVPVTQQTNQVKEDLIGNSEDYFQALIEEGKSDKEAIGIVISEFGTIDEILMALGVEQKEAPNFESRLEECTLNQAQEFWDDSRKFAFNLSFGFLIGFVSLAIIPFWHVGNGGLLTILSVLLTFLLGIIALLFILISYKEQRQLVKEVKKMAITDSVRQVALEKMNDYQRSHLASICLSFVSYGMAFPVLFVLLEFFNRTYLGVVFFFAFCGFGTFLLLYASIVQREYKRLAKNKQKRQKMKWVNLKYDEEIFWVIVTIIYFLASFLFRAWLYSWLIFLIGYVVAEWLMKKEASSSYN